MSAKDSTLPTVSEPQPPAGAVATRPVGMIMTVESLSAQMQQMREVANVISPFTRPSHLAAGFGVSMVAVKLDPTVDQYGNGAECYRGSFMKPDQRAPAKVGLRLLGNGLGIEWLPFPNCRRVDAGDKQHYAEYYVEGVYRTYDGSVQKLTGVASVDFRDGSDQIGGWTPAAWAELMAINRAAMAKGVKKDELDWSINGWSEQRVRGARQKVLERAETAAKNRAIRDIGLKHVYSLAELAKPFVCFRMTFVPDMNDPEIKRLVTMANLQGLAAWYPQASAVTPLPLAAPAEPAVPDAETSETSSPAASSPQTSTSAPPADPIPERQARTIVSAGNTKDGGKFIVLDGGVFCRIEPELVDAAAAIQRDGRQVYVETEDREGEAWAIEMEFVPAPSTDATAATKPPAVPAGETITAIDEKPGQTGDRQWTRARITFSGGKVATTFDATILEVARQAKTAGSVVRYATEPSAKYAGQLDLKSLRVDDGSEPPLPGFESSGKY